MTRRIYINSVKKWAKNLGITSGTLIGLVFLYMFAIGAISDVSYSGDMQCAGTIEDPCYAYINFTANEDIFLYKTDYDPYGRNTTFNFDPAVESWKLERSWGSGWREIDLEEGCTGGWCGCYWCRENQTSEYAYAFREDRHYQIRIVSYKRNAFEDIKWGAFSGVDEIDPVWEGLDWKKDGDKVYYNDSNAYLSATPHTLTSSDYVEFEIKSKNYTGDINVIWGFNTSNTIPKSGELYNPTNETWNTSHSYDIYNVTDFSETELGCDYGNSYNDMHYEVSYLGLNGTEEETNVFCFDSYDNEEDDYRVYWDTKHWKIKEWQDISGDLGMIEYELDGKDTWYYAQDIPIEANQTYKVRSYMEVIPGTQGKYDFAVYPSSYGLTEQGLINANSDGSLYLLDPWWDSSYEFKRNITNVSSNLLLPLNCSGGSDCTSDIDGDGNNEVLYGVPSGSSASVYYNDDTDAVVANDSTETCIIDTLNNRGSCPNSPDDLVAHYALDRDSGDVKDYIGNNDGTNNGATRGETGKIGNCFYFDGSDSVDFTDSVGWNFNSTSFSISLWFNTTRWGSGGPTREAFVGSTDSSYDNGLHFGKSNDNENLTFTIANGSTYDSIKKPHGATLNEWYHAVAIFDKENGLLKLYVNGESIGSKETTHVISSTTSPIYFGWTYNGGNQGYRHYKGQLDEVQIYDRVLSSTEIQTLYEKSNHVSLGSEETGNDPPNQPILNSPEDGSTGIPTNTTLNVTVSDPEGSDMNVSFYNSSGGFICENNLISNNSNVLCNWNDLESNTTYEWYVNVTDNQSSTTTSDTWNFTTDVFKLEILHPEDNLGINNRTFDLNFSIQNETTLDKCLWWVNDTSNQTIPNCKNTTITLNEGKYNLTLWVNNTDGGFGENNVSNFFIDLTNPLWKNNKTNLTSTTKKGQKVYFNITFTDNFKAGNSIFSWYNGTKWLNDSLNSWSNNTEIKETKMINSTSDNLWINWTWYFNDSVGNSNKTDRFNKLIDNYNPRINYTIGTETNNSGFLRNWIFVNVSASDGNNDTITFNLYNSTKDLINSTSFNYGVQQINFTNLSRGIYYYNVSANDTSGNINSTDTRKINLSSFFEIEGFSDNLTVELGSNVSINISGFEENLYLDIEHPDFGDNYLNISSSTIFNLSINSFIKELFSDNINNVLINFSNFSINNSAFSILSHQYDEVDNITFNISSNDFIKSLTFYGCNSSTIDRAYFGYLKDNKILVNQSVSSDGSSFRNYENLTFLTWGDSLVYFYLDKNAKIKNIIMNVSGDSYGLDYDDSFTRDNYTNINDSETDGELFYDTILPKINSTDMYLYDDFEDGYINQTLWINGTYQSGSGWRVGTKETDGNLKLEWFSDNGVALTSGYTRTYTRLIRGETSKNITFSITSSRYDSHRNDVGVAGGTKIYIEDQNIWSLDNPPNDYPDGNEETDAELDFKIIALNATHTKVIINGTENSSNSDGYSKEIVYDNNETIYDTSLKHISFKADGTKGGSDPYGKHILNVEYMNATFSKRNYTTIVSEPVFNPESNISSIDNVYFNISGAQGESSAIYLSADGGDNWEAVTNNEPHTFTNTGNELVWLMLTSIQQPDNYLYTTFLRGVEITINSSEPENISFDFGNDGVYEYNHSGVLNDANSPIKLNLTDANLSGAFTDSRKIYDNTYAIPLKVKTDSAGLINLHNFNISYDPNPVVLNKTYIQTYLDNYGENHTNFTIPIGGQNGSVNITNPKYEYAGGNDTVKLNLHDIDYSFNISRYLTYFYSRWDYSIVPSYVDYIEFIPGSPTEDNVSAYGQTEDTPILNLTNYGYGGKKANLSVYMNDTEDTNCVNITLSFNNKSNGYQLNESWIDLNKSMDYLESTEIWLWADYECDYSNWRLFKPHLYFRQCANGSVCSTEVI